MKTLMKGFTLIELMIVVAIIGILASLAISAYQTYTVRAQVGEAITMGAGAKAPVIDAFNNAGEPPAGRTEAGMTADPTDTRGTYISQVEIVDGRVDVMMGNLAHAEVNGLIVSFTPYMNASGGVVWRCGNAPQPPGTVLLQSADGSAVSAYAATSVPDRYLPSTCRE